MQSGPPAFNWLLPDVLAGGPHPERQDRMGLAELHATFDAVLSVFDEELSKQTRRPWGLKHYKWMRTRDGEAPNLDEACRFIDQARRTSSATLVHCYAGIGRTGTVLAAYLIHIGECATAVEARARVRRDYDPDAIENDLQLGALTTFAQRRRR